jgi:hypothetical protein
MAASPLNPIAGLLYTTTIIIIYIALTCITLCSQTLARFLIIILSAYIKLL